MLTTVALPTPKGGVVGWKSKHSAIYAYTNSQKERERESTTYASQLKCRKNYCPHAHICVHLATASLPELVLHLFVFVGNTWCV